MPLDLSVLNNLQTGTSPQNVNNGPKTRYYKLEELELEKVQRKAYIEENARIRQIGSETKIELLESIEKGDSLYKLLINSIEVISLLTQDKAFKDMCEEKLLTIYPNLGEKEVAEHLIQIKTKQLEQLKKARQSVDDVKVSRRLERAIEKHEQELERLGSGTTKVM